MNSLKATKIEEIYGIQAEIGDLLRGCAPALASSNAVAHKLQKVAEQLLGAAGKIMSVGQDLNAITSCMVDVAEADRPDFKHAPHILAWAGWTGDLTADVLDAVDGLLCSVRDLIGSSRGRRSGGI